ncbi:MAG TPA: ABC transporter ATP-binding protein [Fimbriimonas sp.]|nr:ABC transporter ATP-binding protein [Fimbriimonas sp.]
MSSPLIEIRDLCKVYKTSAVEFHALKNVNLTVEHGDFLAIMGPSGSGKSTLMNVVGCLDVPTSGTYKLDGVRLDELTDDELATVRASKIGFVFQSFNLIPRTSAIENIELPRLYSRNGFKHRREDALARLAEVGLEGWANHLPSELSGGQQQRVAIARSLINDPTVILADEPTGALDTRSGEEIMGIFQKLNRLGKTIIIVTHEADIGRHAKRIVRFRDGQIVSEEKVDQPLQAEALLT